MNSFPFRPATDAAPQELVLTIGNFDGVHLGHQALIRQVVREARETGLRGDLLTFHPHPQSVLRLFEQLGLDAAHIVPFTREFALKSARSFVVEDLLTRFRVRKLIIGYDFHFGRNREGSAELLRQLSSEHGFAFEVFPAVSLGGEKVSSSRIRAALAEADFAAAERLLGRPYSVLETVVHGEQRGRQIGFPTLNLVPGERLPLPYGVYAARVTVQGRSHDGVSNYGLRPTVGGREPVLETYVFGFDAQVYGELAEVFPLRLLRAERKFPSLAALQAQIAADRDAAQAFLATVAAL